MSVVALVVVYDPHIRLQSSQMKSVLIRLILLESLSSLPAKKVAVRIRKSATIRHTTAY
jgi:hypothetical protein